MDNWDWANAIATFISSIIGGIIAFFIAKMTLLTEINFDKPFS